MAASLPLLSGAHPVLTCADAQAWEQQLLGREERTEWAAMAQAGRSCAAAVLADAQEIGGIPDDGQLIALCGKGHNGGDALNALHALLEARPRATALALIVPDFSALRPLARRALEALQRTLAARVKFLCVSGPSDGADAARVRSTVAGARFDACLDGLFGMQFRPPLTAPADWLIALINEHRGIRLRAAVDLPSGVADVSDDDPFRADFTYATGIAKAPLFAEANYSSVGRARYLDLGFFSTRASGARGNSLPLATREGKPAHVPETSNVAGTYVLTDRVLDPLRARRPAGVDKRTFGHLFVVSGSRTMPGAVLMAVESALLSGVGLVTAFVPESLAAAFAARLPEAMWVPMPETLDGGLALQGRGSVIARAARCTGLLAGPGLGRDRESLSLIVDLLRAIDVPAVLDGDALQPDMVSAHYPGSESPRVLTPHAGEFARLAGGDANDDATLRATAARLHATITLKGAPTRVSDGGAVYFNPFGGPLLARGGSGDVLAGLVAGQLAQGGAALEAAARSVVWHGRAADRLARASGQTSARVTQLMPHLAAVLRNGAVAGVDDPGPASPRPATTNREL